MDQRITHEETQRRCWECKCPTDVLRIQDRMDEGAVFDTLEDSRRGKEVVRRNNNTFQIQLTAVTIMEY
jgi:hypothetical protein